ATLVGETTNGIGYSTQLVGGDPNAYMARVQCIITNANGEEIRTTGIKPDWFVSTPCAGDNDCVLEEAIALIKDK
ncbi:MAG: hypothetical protein V1876_02140, partial [Candidatus Peregrinibacteria bacterium]